jgi:hypothetical protein
MPSYTVLELRKIYNEIVHEKGVVPPKSTPRLKHELVNFIQTNINESGLKKNNKRWKETVNQINSNQLTGLGTGEQESKYEDVRFHLDFDELFKNSTLTTSQTIDWVQTMSEKLTSSDYSYIVLYTYMWDNHVNALARHTKLPPEMYTEHIETMRKIARGEESDISEVTCSLQIVDMNCSHYYETGLQQLFKAARTAADGSQLTPQLMETVLAPHLASRLLNVADKIGGMPVQCICYRTIVVPRNAKVKLEGPLKEYQSTSLSAISSLLGFGVNKVDKEQNKTKIVFSQIIIDECVKVLPLFLVGFQASSEQELLIMPQEFFSITQEDYQENVLNPLDFFYNLIKATKTKFHPLALKFPQKILPTVQLDVATLRVSLNKKK